MGSLYGFIPYILVVCGMAVCDTVQLVKYSFHENCGIRLGSADVAGVLTLYAPKVHDAAFSTRRCQVTISPKDLLGARNRVMFYFTEFKLGRECHDNSLTVFDGRYSNEPISGLGGALCGHNTSLEDRLNVFTSTGSDIRLVYRWSETGDIFTGMVNITFIAFYDGPCPSDKGIFTCSTNKCISSDISCNDDVNYCGNGKDSNCDLQELVESFVNTVVNTLKDIGIVVAVIVGIGIVKVCVFDRCKEKYGSVENMPIIRQILNNSNSTSTSNQRRSSVQSQREPTAELDSISVRLRADEDTESLPPSHNDEPPSYGSLNISVHHNTSPETTDSGHTTVEPSAPPITAPLSPPPSYDDVMSNHDRYLKNS